jgi:hypothetical protein
LVKRVKENGLKKREVLLNSHFLDKFVSNGNLCSQFNLKNWEKVPLPFGKVFNLFSLQKKKSYFSFPGCGITEKVKKRRGTPFLPYFFPRFIKR